MARLIHLTNLIDNKIKEVQGTTKNPDKGARRHLGASIIGRPCSRELWYSFRWATRERHDGRVIRLFDRGFEEEARFATWLMMIGATVIQEDPETGRQFGFKGGMGHFAGSMDGKARKVPFQVEALGCDFNDWILVEFKTHGEKSFTKLVLEDDLKISKPEHYAQMVIYIDEHQLPGGLYMAVNKNTDELYAEFVLPNPEFAETIRHKANQIIHSRKAPPRISNSPSWYVCKFCTHRAVCHLGAPIAKSCRTCVYATPVNDGRWHCGQFGQLIPKEFEIKGCDRYSLVHD